MGLSLTVYPPLQVCSDVLPLSIESYILLCSPLVSPVTKGSLRYRILTASWVRVGCARDLWGLPVCQGV